MNSRDVSRALRSGSFIGYSVVLGLFNLVGGGILSSVAPRVGPGSVFFFAWFDTFLILGMARGAAISSYTEDRFSGLLEAPLARSVSRAGLVFGRFLGVVLAVTVGTVVACVTLAGGYQSTGHGFPSAALVGMGVGLVFAGTVLAALTFLITQAAGSAGAVRWGSNGIRYLAFVLLSLFASFANLAVLVLANPFELSLTLGTSGVPFSLPVASSNASVNPVQIFIDPLAASLVRVFGSTRIGMGLLVLIGLGWVALTVGGLYAKTRSSD
jgi:hypothetical protein